LSEVDGTASHFHLSLIFESTDGTLRQEKTVILRLYYNRILRLDYARILRLD